MNDAIEMAMQDIRAALAEPEPCLHMLDYWLHQLELAAQAYSPTAFEIARRRANVYAKRCGYA